MRFVIKTAFVFILIIFSSAFIEDGKSPVNWISFEKAVEFAKKDPKPIMIDVYTKWCGPCKLMSKNTFDDKTVAEYLNKNFYCVKFDAECFDTIRFEILVNDTLKSEDGKMQIQKKAKMLTFVNFAAPGTPKSPHQFAYSILDTKLLYPSIVFLNPAVQRLEIKTGYHTKELFEPIIKYYGSGSYASKSYDEFLKTFKPSFK